MGTKSNRTQHCFFFSRHQGMHEGKNHGERTPMVHEGAPEAMHGLRGDHERWDAPVLATFSKQLARPGYASKNASEYLDTEPTLKQKISLLAEMIRSAKHCVCYSGAGISTSAGVSDYATKERSNVLQPKQKKVSALLCRPTRAHMVLTEMEKRGFLHGWVQQNHDGLPQKAGYPQEKLNEIHGAWFDPSNPVVPMDGELRDDLFEWLCEEEKATDLTLALGSSLCGMNADRMVTSPAMRWKQGHGQGAVIISLQQTQYDDICTLRIFSTLDKVMDALAHELGLMVPNQPPPAFWKLPTPNLTSERNNEIVVKYNSKGVRDENSRMVLHLAVGSKFRLTGANSGREATLVSFNQDGHLVVKFDCRLYRRTVRNVLGMWWLHGALAGSLPTIPIVGRMVDDAPTATLPPTKSLQIMQKHNRIAGTDSQHRWSLCVDSLQSDPSIQIAKVVFHLHPTFSPAVVAVSDAPFQITRQGWGSFCITIEVHWLNLLEVEKSVAPVFLKHNLCFEGENVCKSVTVPLKLQD